MGYERALESAGAKIIAFGMFGSYQGDWWAKVEYNGKVGWVHGCYGSCSVCDSYESYFGCNEPTEEELARFGAEYLDNLYTQEEAEFLASSNLDWDLDAKEMYEFIVSHRNNK